jgi:hypothetical protein
MNLDFAFICDYAEAGAKLKALGIGFDTIFARNYLSVICIFPSFYNYSSVTEAGKKELLLTLSMRT